MKHPTFGDILRARRTERGLSQRALAERMSELGVRIDATSITRMESGQREPKLSEALALADYFSIDLESLVYVADDQDGVAQGGMVWHGLVDQMMHSFFKARMEIRDFLEVAGYAHAGFGYRADDATDAPSVSKKTGEFVEEVIANLIGREAELSERAATPIPDADSELCEWLVRELVRGLWDQSNGDSSS